MENNFNKFPREFNREYKYHAMRGDSIWGGPRM